MSFRINERASRYELEEDGAVSFANYRDGSSGERTLTHFETPVEARNKGTAGRLMEQILAEARASGRKLKARCSYAVMYLERHPEAGNVMR